MATLKIEPGTNGKLWVSFTRYSDAEIARLKQIPGRKWNPERKQWSLPDTPETRKILAEIVAMPPSPPPKMLAVKPKTNDTPPTKKPYKRYIPGKDKPLTTNPPHPFIKQVDDELVLRGMAYGTRKSYGQHLRNYFDWLKAKANCAGASNARKCSRVFGGTRIEWARVRRVLPGCAYGVDLLVRDDSKTVE